MFPEDEDDCTEDNVRINNNPGYASGTKAAWNFSAFMLDGNYDDAEAQEYRD